MIRHSNGMAVEADIRLSVAERCPGGDPYLFAHQVDSADHLRHRVFDLKTGVHLDKEELAVLVQELHGPDTAIAEQLGGPRRQFADAPTLRIVQGRRRRLLDHLLVPPLYRAVAFAEMHDIAVGVGQDLHFDMPRAAQIAFQVDLIVTEGGTGFRSRQPIGGRQFFPHWRQSSCRARRRRPLL